LARTTNADAVNTEPLSSPLHKTLPCNSESRGKGILSLSESHFSFRAGLGNLRLRLRLSASPEVGPEGPFSRV